MSAPSVYKGQTQGDCPSIYLEQVNMSEDKACREEFEEWHLRERKWPAIRSTEPGYTDRYVNVTVHGAWEGYQAAWNRLAAKPAVPEVLFDGYAVLQAMSEKAKARTSPENVSDVLDAAVKLIRAAPTPPETK